MNTYTIHVFFSDYTLNIKDYHEVFMFADPYDAARAYDVIFTFSAMMDTEKFSQAKHHEGDITVVLARDDDKTIRSKTFFLGEDPAKKDARASKIINF